MTLGGGGELWNNCVCVCACVKDYWTDRSCSYRSVLFVNFCIIHYKDTVEQTTYTLMILALNSWVHNNHRLKNTWIRNASRDPLNCQL